MDCYKAPYKKDGNKHGDGLLVYVEEDIPCQLTNHPPVHNLLDIIAIELNFGKHNWLFIAVYKSPFVSDTALFGQMSKVVDFYLQKYQNIVLVVDFNIEPADKKLYAFCESHEFYNLIKSKTCFRSKSGTYIDLILTNQKHSLENTVVIETGLSGFHRMIFTQMILTNEKFLPITISFPDFKNFVETRFYNDLLKALICNPQASYDYWQFLQVLIMFWANMPH